MEGLLSALLYSDLQRCCRSCYCTPVKTDSGSDVRHSTVPLTFDGSIIGHWRNYMHTLTDWQPYISTITWGIFCYFKLLLCYISENSFTGHGSHLVEWKNYNSACTDCSIVCGEGYLSLMLYPADQDENMSGNSYSIMHQIRAQLTTFRETWPVSSYLY